MQSNSENKITELQKQISEAIKNSPENVKNKLINLLVDREIEARVQLLDKALDKIKESRKELAKCKPDVETFSEAGEKLTTTYSKAKFDERKKISDGLSKLETAFEQALSGESFDKLKEIMK